MKILSFDTETRGLDWWDPGQRAFLIAYADADGEYIARVDDDKAVSEFVDRCCEADVLVAHNLPFDVHQLRETIGWSPTSLLAAGTKLYDTEIMARVLFPMGQAGSPSTYRLKTLAQTYLREDAADDQEAIAEMARAIGLKTIRQQGAYYEVWRAYPDVLERYAQTDVRLTYDLFVFMWKELERRPELERVMELERKVAPILIAAEARGVALDTRRVRELLEEETAKAERLRNQLEAEGIQPEGEGSEQSLIDGLLAHGVPLYRRTRTGALATNRYALQEFEADYEIVRLLRDYRESAKLVSTYYGPMSDVEVVHTSFQAIGAWSGRMSSRRPNMQNVPKAARSVIVPRDGYAFVVADYDAIEMRLLAYYTGSREYRDLVANSDPHAWMASKIHGGSPEDFAKGGPNDARRSAAKNSLFAICYGAGAPRITDMNGLPRGSRYKAGDNAVRQGWKRVGDYKYEPARRLIADIKSAIPGFRRLQARIDSKVRSAGHVNTLFGRRQPVGRDKSYVGLNALIQGSAADIMKQGLLNAVSALSDYDAHVLLVVHDELVVEARIEDAERVRELVVQAMKDAYPLDPPLEVTSTVVYNHYGEAK